MEKTNDQFPLELTLQEIMDLHLACRLLVRDYGNLNRSVSGLLTKSALAVGKKAPLAGRILAAAAEENRQAIPGDYDRLTEEIVRAVAQVRRIRIVYHSVRKGKTKDYLLEPFCLEPYPEGRSLYLVAREKGGTAFKTFKLDRIEKLELTEESFRIEPGFRFEYNTRDAWGIWGRDDGETETVRLLFSPFVAQRVRETVWQSGQRITDNPDGSVLWEADIAEPLEMYSWIRGWGPDVEILEPASLRQWFLSDLERLVRTYSHER